MVSNIKKTLTEFKTEYTSIYKCLKALIFLYISVFIFSVFYWMIMFSHTVVTGKNPDTLGQLGDAFGFWNSLFTGAALILVIISVNLQATELKQVSTTFKKDSFERTFFNMINLFNDQRETIEIERNSNSRNVVKGAKAITHILKIFDEVSVVNATAGTNKNGSRDASIRLQKDFKDMRFDQKVLPFKNLNDRELFSSVYHSIYAENDGYFDAIDRYIQIFDSALDFLNDQYQKDIKDKSENEVNEVKEEYEKYAKIIYSQLSDTEVKFVYTYIHAHTIAVTVKVVVR